MDELVWIGVLSFSLAQVIFHYLGDVITSILIFRNPAFIRGTILYFDECYIHESRFDLSVLESNTSKKTYIVLRGITDKIGDNVSIVTDGKTAFRKSVYKKYEMESYIFIEIIGIIIAIICLRNSEMIINMINVVLFISVMCVSILLNSVAYLFQMKKIMIKVGIHSKK